MTEERAIRKAKHFVDRIADGVRKFGTEEKNLNSANSALANFVTKVMPEAGLTPQGLAEIKGYVASKLRPG
jgi:hypothetical protein